MTATTMRLPTTTVSLLVAVLLAACGSSSSTSSSTSSASALAQFRSEYETVRGPFNQTGQAIAQELQRATGQTDAQLAAAFRGLSTRFQSQVSELETFKPPQNLAADWNSVLDAAKRVESDLTSVVAAAVTHSQSAGEQAGASLVTDAGELKSAATTIKQKLGIQ